MFAVYKPAKERKAAADINNLIVNVGKPLEILLDLMKDEEIADVGSANDPQDVIDDDLPGVRFLFGAC